MLSEYNCSPSIKPDGSIRNSSLIKSSMHSSNKSLLLNNKDLNETFSDMKSMDIASRLGHFAWRQMTPSNIQLPVIFR
jgi:hypothetical protein